MKVAILGTENSHALAFAKIICTNPIYKDVEIVGIYGYDDQANQQILDAGYTNYVAKDPHEFLGKVDAVICTARHGNHHYDHALPYLKAGIPAFLDKPLTVDLEKAEELIKAAEESGALICGGSGIKYLDEIGCLKRFCKKNQVLAGNVSAPINMVNEYAGFYFYSAHLVEMTTAIFGSEIKSVLALCPNEQKNLVSVIFDYGDFHVTGNFSDSKVYAARAMSKEDCMDAHTVGSVGYIYEYELRELFEMIRTGIEPEDHETMIRPLRIMHAIEESYQTKKEVTL